MGSESIALVVHRSLHAAVPGILAAMRASSPRPVGWTRAAGDAGDWERVRVRVGQGTLAPHAAVTRWLVLAPDEAACRRVRAACSAGTAELATLPVPASRDAIARVGRHLARTRLGLALGAGGALGYAHVGAITALRDAGHPIDIVGGSGIGAVVGALYALGASPPELATQLRAVLAAELVRRSRAGAVAGRERMVDVLRGLVGERRIEQLPLPFVAVAHDIDAGRPVALTSGSLWKALAAATALPSAVSPFERDGLRLVAAQRLVPVPSAVVARCGADITLAVDLLDRGTSDAPIAPDVLVAPHLGRASRRDVRRADELVAAGRDATCERLATLGELARPIAGASGCAAACA